MIKDRLLKYSLSVVKILNEESVSFNNALNTFSYGYMASDIWLRTILIVRKETHCRHTGYSYRLTAKVLLYAPSHRQDNTYHGLCYTSRGALAFFIYGYMVSDIWLRTILIVRKEREKCFI